jgi:hypothetical protein
MIAIFTYSATMIATDMSGIRRRWLSKDVPPRTPDRPHGRSALWAWALGPAYQPIRAPAACNGGIAGGDSVLRMPAWLPAETSRLPG